MDHQLMTARAVRAVLWERQGGQCASCWTGMRPDEMHAHHRMRRRDLGWCPCNVVGLHPSCHVVAPEAVHQRPQWARERGLIVPTWTEHPAAVAVLVRWPWTAWSLLTCDGLVVSAPEDRPGLHDVPHVH